MNNKISQSDHILAASFVDGELSPAEVSRVESRINSDQEFASVVADLRQQSAAFKSLPIYQPASDLADRTLQASVDQVQAIMGHWPGTDEEADSDRDLVPARASQSNWKSVAALIVSLAGLALLALTYWPQAFEKSPSFAGVASHDAVSEPKAESMPAELDGVARKDAADEIELSETEESAAQVVEADMEGMQLESAPTMEGKSTGLPAIASFSGTPATPNRSKEVTVANKNVAQIWWVHTDESSDEIGNVLASNRIQVNSFKSADTAMKKSASSRSASGKSDLANKFGFGAPADKANSVEGSLPDTPDGVEAYYIAATPVQMKRALVELSGRADIALFEVPKSNSENPFADEIEKQFQKKGQNQGTSFGTSADLAVDDSNGVEMADPFESESDQFNSDLPSAIEAPQSRALAQKLVARSLPRSAPSAPRLSFDSAQSAGSSSKPAPRFNQQLPPLPSSDMDEEIAEAIAKSKAIEKSKLIPPQDSAVAGGGGGFGGGIPGGQKNRKSPQRQAKKSDQQQSVQSAQLGQQEATIKTAETGFDQYFDDSDSMLRPYLILVRSRPDVEVPLAPNAQATGQELRARVSGSGAKADAEIEAEIIDGK